MICLPEKKMLTPSITATERIDGAKWVQSTLSTVIEFFQIYYIAVLWLPTILLTLYD